MIVTLNECIDLNKIYESGQCFQWEKNPHNVYVIPHRDKSLKVQQIDSNALFVSCSEDEWNTVWSEYFDLDYHYDSIISMIDTEDKFLVQAAEYSKGMRILKQDLWETIISFIISQNNNIPRIKKIISNLCSVYGRFPTTGDINAHPEYLDTVGLGYRVPYVKEAAKIKLESLNGLSYSESKMSLLTHRGIGPKVADCICLYGLGHKESFPIDTWMKKILSKYYAEKEFPADAYREFAGILQQYMFYYERHLSKIS